MMDHLTKTDVLQTRRDLADSQTLTPRVAEILPAAQGVDAPPALRNTAESNMQGYQ